MKFELKTHQKNIPNEELLSDLKRIAQVLKRNSFTTREYDANGGKFGSGTIYRRFNGWNNALNKAGLDTSVQLNIPLKELFENMEKIWIELGKQPTYRNISTSNSKYSASTYENRFGTWNKALEAFVNFINEPIVEESIEELSEPIKNVEYKHITKRQPSERLKVQVLIRDGNKCRLCGIQLTGKDIHFDHIIPWSKGGETTLNNLQVLCAKHNLAKGNFDVNSISLSKT